jgi:hypothetical protein
VKWEAIDPDSEFMKDVNSKDYAYESKSYGVDYTANQNYWNKLAASSGSNDGITLSPAGTAPKSNLSHSINIARIEKEYNALPKKYKTAKTIEEKNDLLYKLKNDKNFQKENPTNFASIDKMVQVFQNQANSYISNPFNQMGLSNTEADRAVKTIQNDVQNNNTKVSVMSKNKQQGQRPTQSLSELNKMTDLKLEGFTVKQGTLQIDESSPIYAQYVGDTPGDKNINPKEVVYMLPATFIPKTATDDSVYADEKEGVKIHTYIYVSGENYDITR